MFKLKSYSNALFSFWVYCPPVTPASGPSSSPSQGSSVQNGPSSSTSDPHNTHNLYSSDNDEDSEAEDEALQKEISRLREKYAAYHSAVQHSSYLTHKCSFTAQNDWHHLSFSQTYDGDSGFADSSEGGDWGPLHTDGKTTSSVCLLTCSGHGWRST